MATKRFHERLHIMITSDERVMLTELAEREGLRPSDEVRQLIRRAHVAAFGEGTPAPAPTRTSRRAPARKRKR